MPANNSVIPVKAIRSGDQRDGDVIAIGELQTGDKIGIQHINTGTLVTNTAFQSALANTNAYIAYVSQNAGEVSNSYLTSTFTANSAFQSALANTNSYIATKLNSSSYTVADVQSKAALANTNAYIATKLDSSSYTTADVRSKAALANTNAYIATKLDSSSYTTADVQSKAALANTNAYIATKLDSSSYTTADVQSKAALANTNAYIATKVNSSNPTITGALSANGSVGTSGYVLKSAGAGNPAYWDVAGGSGTNQFPFYVGGSLVSTLLITDGAFPFYDNTGSADNIGYTVNGAIEDLQNVDIISPADNEVLAFHSANNTWINQTAGEAGLATAATQLSYLANTNSYIASNLANTNAYIATTASTRVTLSGANNSAVIPYGTTAQRDVSPNTGYFRYNITTGSAEIYDGSAWGDVGGGGATGGGNDDVFYENSANVTTSYTITSGKNAMSAGPITVDTGVTVTIPTGSRWVVV